MRSGLRLPTRLSEDAGARRDLREDDIAGAPGETESDAADSAEATDSDVYGTLSVPSLGVLCRRREDGRSVRVTRIGFVFVRPSVATIRSAYSSCSARKGHL